MEIRANATHYMQFPHTTSGLVLADFSWYLYKNGARKTDIAITVTEEVSGIYTFSFANDGTHESLWSLIVWETAEPDLKYGESWIVRDDAERNAVIQIQNTTLAGGGVGGSPGVSIGRS